MSLLPLVILCATLTAPANDADVPRVVPDELVHLSFEAGDRIRVIARYRSQVGTRIGIEESDWTFEVPAESRFDVLYDSKSRRGLLEILARADDSSGRIRWVVESIAVAAPVETLLAERLAAWSLLDDDRRRALLSWGFRVTEPDGEEAHPAREQVAETWARGRDPALSEGLIEGVRWLETAHPMLVNDPRWVEFANDIAKKHGNDVALVGRLEELGLIRGHGAWRPRAVFLREYGMVEREGELMTIDHSHLRDEIDRWNGLGQQASLLRGKTSAQYAKHIAAAEVIEGMSREEVVQSWGYPHRVTWQRGRDEFFEGWTYPEREVYLVDGHAFMVLE